MNAKLREIPGIDTQFSQDIEDNVDEAVSGIKSECSGHKVFGSDTYHSWHRRPYRRCHPDRARRNGCRHRKADGPAANSNHLDRAAIARYGLAVSDMQTVVATAIGGEQG